MVDQSMEILEAESNWSSEIYYATKEQVKIAAFINNSNELV